MSKVLSALARGNYVANGCIISVRTSNGPLLILLSEVRRYYWIIHRQSGSIPDVF